MRGKRNLAIKKSCDRDFIGGVHNSRQGAARLARASREIERRENRRSAAWQIPASDNFRKSSGGREFGTRSGQVTAY